MAAHLVARGLHWAASSSHVVWPCEGGDYWVFHTSKLPTSCWRVGKLAGTHTATLSTVCFLSYKLWS